MPIFEYQCPVCKKVEEELVMPGEPDPILLCHGVLMERVLSACSFKLKGFGWSFDGYSNRPWGKKPYHKAVNEDGYVPGSYVETGKAQFSTPREK